MKITVGYSMGFAGTDTEWIEEIPQEVVVKGPEAIQEYLTDLQNQIWEQACENISVWVGEIEQE
jgi:hypothetical protein